MPAIEKLDWNAAFDEFLLVHKPKGMKQYEFAELKNVDKEWLSTKFTEIRNERLMTKNKSRMPKLLSMGLDEIEAALQMESGFVKDEPGLGISSEFKAKLGLETVKAMADRLGMSPQAMTINMQQLNQNKTVLAVPIFAAQASPMMDKFLGSVDADTKTDS